MCSSRVTKMFYTQFCGVLLIATQICVAQDQSNVHVLKYNSENSGLGSYRYAYALSDGQERDEEGELQHPQTEHEAMVVKGSFSYVGPDGVTYTVKYTADKNGFHPEGDHFKVPPFVPWEHVHHDDQGSGAQAPSTGSQVLAAAVYPSPSFAGYPPHSPGGGNHAQSTSSPNFAGYPSHQPYSSKYTTQSPNQGYSSGSRVQASGGYPSGKPSYTYPSPSPPAPTYIPPKPYSPAGYPSSRPLDSSFGEYSAASSNVGTKIASSPDFENTGNTDESESGYSTVAPEVRADFEEISSRPDGETSTEFLRVRPFTALATPASFTRSTTTTVKPFTQVIPNYGSNLRKPSNPTYYPAKSIQPLPNYPLAIGPISTEIPDPSPLPLSIPSSTETNAGNSSTSASIIPTDDNVAIRNPQIANSILEVLGVDGLASHNYRIEEINSLT